MQRPTHCETSTHTRCSTVVPKFPAQQVTARVFRTRPQLKIATIRAMESVMNNLQELYECRLDTRWLPSEALPFICQAFSQNELELRCQDIRELGNLATMAHLSNLQELESWPAQDSPSETIQIAEFLSKLDVSSFSVHLATPRLPRLFFVALGPFPRLRKLVLGVDLSEKSLSDPFTLLRFLIVYLPLSEILRPQRRFPIPIPCTSSRYSVR
ncbi:hypothetical protein PLEOSDRAFT_1091088, partial [Pleurotus ostreatus PC15]